MFQFDLSKMTDKELACLRVLASNAESNYEYMCSMCDSPDGDRIAAMAEAASELWLDIIGEQKYREEEA